MSKKQLADLHRKWLDWMRCLGAALITMCVVFQKQQSDQKHVDAIQESGYLLSLIKQGWDTICCWFWIREVTTTTYKTMMKK